MQRARPTIRCLREDLNHTLPPADQPLDAFGHVIVEKANALSDSRWERIASIDDRVFFKIKAQRWRGALWRPLPEQWLCAAGWREQGSPDDFYNDLARRCQAWRREYNRSHSPALTTATCSDPLLPTDLDRKRLVLEAAAARSRTFRAAIQALIHAAIVTEVEQYVMVEGFGIGILIQRRELDEVYVGVRIRGPVSTKDHAVILSRVPGTDPAGWFIDTMPHRDDQPGETVWSNVMDPDIAASILAGKER